ncbi:MAG: hypothetical protein QF561_05330 [Phycisphaerales bacterium]|nr:hypothetical protein [Phycisphaerales bacterium]
MDGGGIFCHSGPTSLESTTLCGNSPNQLQGPWTDLGGNLIHDECGPPCPDINEDGHVGVDDILAVISRWGSNDTDVDVTGNGLVDAEDLLLIIANWGPCDF